MFYLLLLLSLVLVGRSTNSTPSATPSPSSPATSTFASSATVVPTSATVVTSSPITTPATPTPTPATPAPTTAPTSVTSAGPTPSSAAPTPSPTAVATTSAPTTLQCDAVPVDQINTSTCQIRASDGQTVSTLFAVGQRDLYAQYNVTDTVTDTTACRLAVTTFYCSFWFPSCTGGSTEEPICRDACLYVNEQCGNTDACSSYTDYNGNVVQYSTAATCTWQRRDRTETSGSGCQWYDSTDCLREAIIAHQWETGLVAGAALLLIIIILILIACCCRCCRRRKKEPKVDDSGIFKSLQDMANAGMDIELGGKTGQEVQRSSSLSDEFSSSKPAPKSSSSASSAPAPRKASISSDSAPSLSHSSDPEYYVSETRSSIEMLPTGAPVDGEVLPSSESQHTSSASDSLPQSSEEQSQSQSESQSQSSSHSDSDPGAPSDSDAIGGLDDMLEGI